MTSAAETEFSQLPVDPRHFPVCQKTLQVNRAKLIFLRFFQARFPHAYERDFRRILPQNILRHRPRVDKTA